MDDKEALDAQQELDAIFGPIDWNDMQQQHELLKRVHAKLRLAVNQCFSEVLDNIKKAIDDDL